MSLISTRKNKKQKLEKKKSEEDPPKDKTVPFEQYEELFIEFNKLVRLHKEFKQAAKRDRLIIHELNSMVTRLQDMS